MLDSRLLFLLFNATWILSPSRGLGEFSLPLPFEYAAFHSSFLWFAQVLETVQVWIIVAVTVNVWAAQAHATATQAGERLLIYRTITLRVIL